jgi:hypothetical protein
MGADLREANLRNVSLVHADLTQARLSQVDWLGADLSGANLTGSQLYGVSRLGLKIDGLICEWVDLSVDGDRSEVYRFTPEQVKRFFNETQPKVQITIKASLTFNAHLLLASIYQRIFQFYPKIKFAPSLEVGENKTVLTFCLDKNERLLVAAFLGIFPFHDREVTHRQVLTLIEMLTNSKESEVTDLERQKIEAITQTMIILQDKLASVQGVNLESLPSQTAQFFEAPTKTILINSSDETFEVYHHPQLTENFNPKITPPSLQQVLQFINSGLVFFNQNNRV